MIRAASNMELSRPSESLCGLISPDAQAPFPAMPSLEAKVSFLSQAASYSEPLHRVESIETHMSWVFLAGNHAYKLKKPVCTEFADLRKLDMRRYFCGEELRLNRRLAKAIYLGVVPLVLDHAEHLQLGGDGAVVDWLVQMQRIPGWLMLDSAIAHRSACAEDAARIAAALTRFYRTLAPEDMTPLAYRARFHRQLEAGRTALSDPAYAMPAEHIGALFGTLTAALMRHASLLDERIRAQRLLEGHGDLRPEHVCLLPEIAIIDCLEFSRDLRVLDPADEVGYLALEFERLGAPSLAAALMQAYRGNSGDTPPPALVHFYQACRAATRSFLAARHLKEEKFRYSAHWRRTALVYLELALRHARASNQA